MIHQLRNDGLSISAIARRLNLSRPTVRKFLRCNQNDSDKALSIRRASKLDPYRDYLNERLKQCPELTGTRLLREINKLGYQGGYSILTEYLSDIRPRSQSAFEVRFETPAGQQAQVDFAHFRTEFLDDPGALRCIWLFAMVLGYSRKLWGEFCLRQDLSTVIEKHIKAFTALGGSPRQVVYDRMKTAVIGEDEKGDVIYNQSLLSMLNHYGATPWACQPYRAKTKGKIERNFSYVRSSFFAGSRFENLAQLNDQFASWQTEVADQRVHGTTGRIVAEMFDEERSALQPLPKIPYQALLSIERKVNREGMVAYRNNWYSIPDGCDTRIVEVQVLPFELRIVNQGEVIARHDIVSGKGERVINPAHRKVEYLRQIEASEPPLPDTPAVLRRPLEVYQAVGQQLAAQSKKVDR